MLSPPQVAEPVLQHRSLKSNQKNAEEAKSLTQVISISHEVSYPVWSWTGSCSSEGGMTYRKTWDWRLRVVMNQASFVSQKGLIWVMDVLIHYPGVSGGEDMD